MKLLKQTGESHLITRINKYVAVVGLLWLVTSLLLIFLAQSSKAHTTHPQQIKAHHGWAYQAARASFIY
ncbi:MAG TPA: hypothetical protein VFB79_02365 [Candidatus Angelobacter sp.]|nr:hypothetical protein [Candidatus Angelobacter sp.]